MQKHTDGPEASLTKPDLDKFPKPTSKAKVTCIVKKIQKMKE